MTEYARTEFPQTWTCCDCGRTGDATPGAEPPAGTMYQWNPETKLNETVGDLCADCMKAPAEKQKVTT